MTVASNCVKLYVQLEPGTVITITKILALAQLYPTHRIGYFRYDSQIEITTDIENMDMLRFGNFQYSVNETKRYIKELLNIEFEFPNSIQSTVDKVAQVKAELARFEAQIKKDLASIGLPTKYVSY
jgi:hypothetical protein